MNQNQKNLYNELISKYNFKDEQKEQIKLGIENNVNVSIYTNPKFDWKQMKQIRLELEKGLNSVEISKYVRIRLAVIKHDFEYADVDPIRDGYGSYEFTEVVKDVQSYVEYEETIY